MKNNFIFFSKLFAVFYLSNLGFLGNWYPTYISPFLIAASILVLVYTRVLYVNLFLLLYCLEAIIKLPVISNSPFFALVIALTFLSTQLVNYILKREDFFNRSMAQCYTVILIALIVVYFWSVWHKLNYDFFDLSCSCAISLFNEGIDLPRWISDNNLLRASYQVIIYSTLVFEIGIPILLFFKRTRMVGICAGFIFHFALARTHFDFSALTNALFVFLLPIEVTQVMESKVPKVIWNSKLVKVGVAAFIVTISAVGHLSSSLMSFKITATSWGVVHLLIVIVLYRSTVWKFLNFCSFPQQRMAIWQYSVPLFLFINGACPYLGLKTEYSFSMFSNLKVEQGMSNHFVIKKPLGHFSFLNRVVFIHSTNVPGLIKYVNGDLGLTYFEFQKIILRSNMVDNNALHVTFTYNDKLCSVDNLSEIEVFPEYNNWIASKFLRFRDVQIDGTCKCLH